MREILFRGKAINREEGREYRTSYKNGDWVYGLVTKLYDERFELLPATMTNEYGISGIEVDHNTIGQYTGLTANGKEIFEGDIVESRASENKEDWKYWQVIFYDGSYCFEKDNPHKRKYKYEQNLLSEDEIELYGLVVVGNIHDNPELLKGVKE